MMFKVIVDTILRDAEASDATSGPGSLCRDELKALFRDDFAAHAMIVRSRKAARAAQVQMAA